MNQILVVEDETVIRDALKRLLERHGYAVSEAGTVRESLEKFNVDEFDVIISDLRLPGAPGTDLIKATCTPVVIMTSYSSIRSAVDSIQMGAVDYISKPFKHQEIIATLGKIVQQRISTAPTQRIRAEAGGNGKHAENHELPIQNMIGSCPPMQELFRKIRKVASTDSTVLINGESGTGKELVARAIHRISNRQTQEMISVNCAAISENLVESELFGHEKGAFTGATATRTGLVEAAHGSTLFLDEIGELPLDAQARLLRVLQENEIRKVGSVQSRKVDVRLVAATHRDLQQLVANGHFREDLYYRINVMTLLIPPLRERGKDIPQLADAILQATCRRLNTRELHFTAAASQAIAEYPWPGNVRELENAIERAVVLAESDTIGTDLLAIYGEPGARPGSPLNGTNGALTAAVVPPEESLEDYFQRFVLEHQDTMNETQLAGKLGISRKCLWERRQRFGIPRKKKPAQ